MTTTNPDFEFKKKNYKSKRVNNLMPVMALRAPEPEHSCCV